MSLLRSKVTWMRTISSPRQWRPVFVGGAGAIAERCAQRSGRRCGIAPGKGWEQFTDVLVQRLAVQRSGLVFLLWGATPRRKRP